jgi:hypothetical protein
LPFGFQSATDDVCANEAKSTSTPAEEVSVPCRFDGAVQMVLEHLTRGQLRQVLGDMNAARIEIQVLGQSAAGRQPVHLRQAAVRPQQGLQAADLAGQGAQLYLVRPDLPVKKPEGVRRLREEEPRQAELRLGRRAGHLAMEYLKMASDTFILHVAYRGTEPQLTDLLAGRLVAASVGSPAVLQFIQAGCIATGTTQRIPQLPDVPTVAEQGLTGLRDDAVVRPARPGQHGQAGRLRAGRRRGGGEDAAGEKPGADAAIAVGNAPAEFAKFIAVEQQRWKAVVARAKIRPD